MPPQKNSGNRGAKRDTNASIKNRRFVQDFLSDIRADGNVENVFVGRVTHKMGNGRMEVMYSDNKMYKNTQAVIRGSFRGKARHSLWIEIGTFVAIADTGLAGSSAFEIVAVLKPDQMRDIVKELGIDDRILDPSKTDMDTQFVTGHENTGGFEFADEEEEVNIDTI